MRLGFTGTRFGMSDKQKLHVEFTLRNFGGVLEIATHGSCIGADAEFHEILRLVRPGCKIIIRPGVSQKTGVNDDTRAMCVGDLELPPNTFYARNRDIVDNCDFLIGTPLNDDRLGGTWQTLKYAKKVKRIGLIIYPDGSKIMISQI